MKSLFILGAGASKKAGAPLMNDFLDCAYDLLRLKTPGVIESKNEFEDVFNAISELQGVHSKSYLDLDNIEIVFGAIEMGLLLKRLGKRDEESINTLHKSLITLIYKTLEYSIPFPVRNNRIHPPKPYDSFMQLLTSVREKQPYQDPHQFSFITFNYDLCLDFALFFSGIKYDYFLEFVKNTKASPLLKLHGSINWGLFENKKIEPYFINEANFSFLMNEKQVYFNLGTNLKGKNGLDGPPIIIPPTWNKNSYHNQLSNVWSKAAFEFSEAENIFVIGYSLPETDSFFRYLYALGSESTTKLRNFIVINKDTTDNVEKRFRNLIGKGIESRFKYIPTTFEDGLDAIRDILVQ